MSSMPGGSYQKSDPFDESGESDQLGAGQNAHDLQLEELALYFHLPISEAAKAIGVCATVLKKICRKNNIPRWPHRKIKSINKMISVLESSVGKNPEDDARIREEIKTLSQHREYVMKNPDSLVQSHKRKRDSPGSIGSPGAKRLRREDGSSMPVPLSYGAPPAARKSIGGKLDGMMGPDLGGFMMPGGGGGGPGGDDGFGHQQHYPGQLGYPFPSVEMQDWNMARLAQQQQQLAALYYPLMTSQGHDPQMQGHDFGHHVGFSSQSAAALGNQQQMNDPSADHRFAGLSHIQSPMGYPNMPHPHPGQFAQQFMHGLGYSAHMNNLANQSANLGNHPSNLGNQGNLGLGGLGGPGGHMGALGNVAGHGALNNLGNAAAVSAAQQQQQHHQQAMNLLGSQHGQHHDHRQQGPSSTGGAAGGQNANTGGQNVNTGGQNVNTQQQHEYGSMDHQMMHMLQQHQQNNASSLHLSGGNLPFLLPGQHQLQASNIVQQGGMNGPAAMNGGSASMDGGAGAMNTGSSSNPLSMTNTAILNTNSNTAIGGNNSANPGTSPTSSDTPQTTPPPSQSLSSTKPDWYQNDSAKPDYLSMNSNEKMGLA